MALVCFICFLGLVATGIVAYSVSQELALERAGIPRMAACLIYEGGMNGLAPGRLRAWKSDGQIKFATTGGRSASLAISDVVAVTIHSNVQNVNTGGGRSVGGAVVGLAIAGPLGAIVGGRSRTQVKKVDETRTLLVYRRNNVQMQMVFVGGAHVHAALANLLECAEMLPPKRSSLAAWGASNRALLIGGPIFFAVAMVASGAAVPSTDPPLPTHRAAAPAPKPTLAAEPIVATPPPKPKRHKSSHHKKAETAPADDDTAAPASSDGDTILQPNL